MTKRTGLPSFQGGRLRQAREVRQTTASALAERVNVTGATVSLWEKARAQPRSELLGEIARVLELPEAFFLRPLFATAPDDFRFRSLSAATKRARRAAQGRVQWLHEIVCFLAAEVEIPAVSIPDLDLPSDPTRITNEMIENAADATRRAWGLRDGPIPDVNKLIEAHGVIVGRLALNAAELDGLSAWSEDGRPYIVLNSEKASCVRSRFDAAHELGHLILHRRAPARPESPVHKLMENQAHRYAGAFIFPSSAVVDEIAHSDLDALVRVKERWRLSLGALVFRLFQLGLIDEYRKDRLQRQLSARGWRTWEPLDDELQPERPTIVRQAYHLLCENAGWTPLDILREVPLAEHDHELLAHLPSRWMQGHHREYGELVKLRSSPAPDVGETNQRPGKVLRFPGVRSDD